VISAKEFDELARAALDGAPFASDPDVFRAVLRLTAVAARIERDFEATVLRPAGLTWPGFRLLFCLSVCGPLETRELARLVFTTPPTVSSVLKTLERQQMIVRARQPADQRLVTISLTPLGAQLFHDAW
jgi:DNA-binding MarR family transcriptional regulator